MITTVDKLKIAYIFDFQVKKENHIKILHKYAHHAVYDKVGNELQRAIKFDTQDMLFMINDTLFKYYPYGY